MKFKDMLLAICAFISILIVTLIIPLFSCGITMSYFSNNSTSKVIQLGDVNIQFKVPVADDTYRKDLTKDLAKNIGVEDEVRIYQVDIIPVIDSLRITVCEFKKDADGLDDVLEALRTYGLLYYEGEGVDAIDELISRYTDSGGNDWEAYNLSSGGGNTSEYKLYVTNGYAVITERTNNNPINKSHLDRIQIVENSPSIKKMKDGYVKLGNVVIKPKKLKESSDLKSMEVLGTKVKFEYPMNMKYSGDCDSIDAEGYAFKSVVNSCYVLMFLVDKEINNVYDLNEFLYNNEIIVVMNQSPEEVYHEINRHTDNNGVEWVTYEAIAKNGYKYNMMFQIGRDENGTHVVFFGNTLHTPKIDIESTSTINDIKHFRIGDSKSVMYNIHN